MGYLTDFSGEFEFDKKIDGQTCQLINDINDNGFLSKTDKPSGSYSLWETDGVSLYADSGKAYDFDRWIELIVNKIVKPRGYILNGEVEWIGEDPDDRGKITINNNLIKYKLAQIKWVDS
jgi:hypothetical protein